MAKSIISKVTSKINKFVAKNGRTSSKVFVWLFALVLILCGVISVFGFIVDFIRQGVVPYKAINDFVKEYFSASTIAAFCAVGVLLIDKDSSGIPDKFECELDKLKEGIAKNVKMFE